MENSTLRTLQMAKKDRMKQATKSRQLPEGFQIPFLIPMETTIFRGYVSYSFREGSLWAGCHFGLKKKTFFLLAYRVRQVCPLPRVKLKPCDIVGDAPEIPSKKKTTWRTLSRGVASSGRYPVELPENNGAQGWLFWGFNKGGWKFLPGVM